MELSRFMQHLNRGFARALIALAIAMVIMGYSRYLATQTFDFTKFFFGSGYIIVCVALGVISSAAAANLLAVAAERGKLK